MFEEARESLTDFESSIFDASDGHKLVDLIRRKKGLQKQTRKIFDDVPTSRPSLHVEIQRLEDINVLQPTASTSAAIEKENDQNLPGPQHSKRKSSIANIFTSPQHKIESRRLSHAIGRRTLLKEFEKTLLQESRFLPPTFSTPLDTIPSKSPNRIVEKNAPEPSSDIQDKYLDENVICTPITISDDNSPDAVSENVMRCLIKQNKKLNALLVSEEERKRAASLAERENKTPESPIRNKPHTPTKESRQTFTIHRDTESGNIILSPSKAGYANRQPSPLRSPVKNYQRHEEERKRAASLAERGNKTPESPNRNKPHTPTKESRQTFTIQRDTESGNLILSPSKAGYANRQPSPLTTPVKNYQRPILITPEQRRLLLRRFSHRDPSVNESSVPKISRIPAFTKETPVPPPPNIEPTVVQGTKITGNQDTAQFVEQLQKNATSNYPVIVIPVNQTFNQAPIDSVFMRDQERLTSKTTSLYITDNILQPVKPPAPNRTVSEITAPLNSVSTNVRSCSSPISHHQRPVTPLASEIGINTLRFEDIITDDECPSEHAHQSHKKQPTKSTRAENVSRRQISRISRSPSPEKQKDSQSKSKRAENVSRRQISRISRSPSPDKQKDSQSKSKRAENVSRRQISRISRSPSPEKKDSQSFSCLDLRVRNSLGQLRSQVTTEVDQQLEEIRHIVCDKNYEDDVLPPPPDEFCDPSNSDMLSSSQERDLIDEVSSDRVSIDNRRKKNMASISTKSKRGKKPIPEDVKNYLATEKKRWNNLLDLSKRKLYSKGMSDRDSSDNNSPEVLSKKNKYEKLNKNTRPTEEDLERISNVRDSSHVSSKRTLIPSTRKHSKSSSVNSKQTKKSKLVSSESDYEEEVLRSRSRNHTSRSQQISMQTNNDEVFIENVHARDTSISNRTRSSSKVNKSGMMKNKSFNESRREEDIPAVAAIVSSKERVSRSVLATGQEEDLSIVTSKSSSRSKKIENPLPEKKTTSKKYSKILMNSSSDSEGESTSTSEPINKRQSKMKQKTPEKRELKQKKHTQRESINSEIQNNQEKEHYKENSRSLHNRSRNRFPSNSPSASSTRSISTSTGVNQAPVAMSETPAICQFDEIEQVFKKPPLKRPQRNKNAVQPDASTASVKKRTGRPPKSSQLKQPVVQLDTSTSNENLGLRRSKREKRECIGGNIFDLEEFYRLVCKGIPPSDKKKLVNNTSKKVKPSSKEKAKKVTKNKTNKNGKHNVGNRELNSVSEETRTQENRHEPNLRADVSRNREAKSKRGKTSKAEKAPSNEEPTSVAVSRDFKSASEDNWNEKDRQEQNLRPDISKDGNKSRKESTPKIAKIKSKIKIKSKNIAAEEITSATLNKELEVAPEQTRTDENLDELSLRPDVLNDGEARSKKGKISKAKKTPSNEETTPVSQIRDLESASEEKWNQKDRHEPKTSKDGKKSKEAKTAKNKSKTNIKLKNTPNEEITSANVSRIYESASEELRMDQNGQESNLRPDVSSDGEAKSTKGRNSKSKKTLNDFSLESGLAPLDSTSNENVQRPLSKSVKTKKKPTLNEPDSDNPSSISTCVSPIDFFSSDDGRSSSIDPRRLQTITEHHEYSTSITVLVERRMSCNLMPPPTSTVVKKSTKSLKPNKSEAFRKGHDETIADISSAHVNNLFDQLKNSSMNVSTVGSKSGLDTTSDGQASRASHNMNQLRGKKNRVRNCSVRIPKMKLNTISDSGFSSSCTESSNKKTDVLFDWLVQILKDGKRNEKGPVELEKILQPNGYISAKADELVFNEHNGVDFALYAKGPNDRFGYMRFRPRTQKKNCIARKREMSYILLGGRIKITINGDPLHLKNGDLVTVFVGAKYSLENVSDDPALLMVIKNA